ncbi:MAG TPA: alpha/beta fold hydrolase [Bacteroidetes bacterium]|nr:alpha/beta fold hydrolase [Bacteroidota bacterium]
MQENNYLPPLLLQNGHFNTIFRTVFTNPQIHYQRKRTNTPDHDFLDLDFSIVGSDKIIIIVHGLEGSSQSKYVISNALFFNRNDYDICAINLRGCSGEMNKLYSSYHSGKTDDLDIVIKEIESNYQEIILLGYSLGGNLVIKYGGEKGSSINSKIKNILAVSVPADLTDSAKELAKPKNFLYQYVFMQSLRKKLKEKIELFPESGLSIIEVAKIKNFKQFDDVYTSVAHGFKNADDYWRKNSCKQFIQDIKIPSLMLNALDDPFLGKKCYPFEQAKNNPFFTLETPKYGGHVGFNISYNNYKNNWLENRIMKFINN